MSRNCSKDSNIYKTSFLIGICFALIVICTFSAFLLARHFFMSDQSPDLDSDESRQIAMQDAGENLSNVTFTRNNLEKENDRMVYRVEFYTDEKSYHYMIDGMTGSISKKNVEPNHTTVTASNKNELPEIAESSSISPADRTNDALEYIGVKKAQQIVLQDAGLSFSEVTFEKADLDHEKNQVVYDVHFNAHGLEYEYKINALTGTIMDMEKEIDDDDD